MTAFDYNKAHAVAVKLITKFGQTGEVVKVGNDSGYDTSGNAIPVQSGFVTNGRVTPLLRYKKSEVDGESVLMTDSYVFFESSSSPGVGMMITINDEQFRIIDISKLTSVDDISVYRKLQLRRG